MKIVDGGPAFPVVVENGWLGHTGYGMTLRDWFAGQVLGNLDAQRIADLSRTMKCDPATSAARVAYGMADAMISARTYPPEGES